MQFLVVYVMLSRVLTGVLYSS